MAKAKTIVQITDPAEMAGFIKSNGTQCRFVGILTRTPVVDIRAKNPWGAGRKTRTGLFKVSRKIGIINANYVSSVSRRIAEKLGVGLESVEYVPGQVWYEHLKTIDGKNLPLVQHKDTEKRVSNAFRREGRSPLRVLKHPPDKGAKPFSVPSLFLRDVFFSLIVV